MEIIKRYGGRKEHVTSGDPMMMLLGITNPVITVVIGWGHLWKSYYLWAGGWALIILNENVVQRPNMCKYGGNNMNPN